MAVFACIYVPDFPVQAVLRAEPGLRSQPVAVLEGNPPLQKVFALNQKARAIGIEPGMTRVQVEACAGLALRPRSSLQETGAHAALLECAQSFSPRVENSADDTFLLDLAGLEALFGPLSKIAPGLHHRIFSLGLEANIAVAANADTAILAARGFPGITIIPAGQEAKTLGILPLSVLFAGRGGRQSVESASEGRREISPALQRWGSPGKTGKSQRDGRNPRHSNAPDDPQAAERLLETFERWGIRDLRALAALPEVALSERLGQEGVFLQQLARGAVFRDLVPLEPLPAFEKEIELEYPLVLLEPLAFLLNQMLEEICAHLAAYALATQEIILRLELCDGHFDGTDMDSVGTGPFDFAPGRLSIFTRTLRLPTPLLDPKTFLKLLQLDLNANPPGAPICRIHLTANPSRPRAAQAGLFLPPSPEPEKLELTLARIAGIVGEHKSGSVELLDTHRPEGFRMQHFAPEQAQESRRKRTTENAITIGEHTASVVPQLDNEVSSRAKRGICSLHGTAETADPSSPLAPRNDNHSGLSIIPDTSETRALPISSQDWSFSAISEVASLPEPQVRNHLPGLVTALRIFRPPVCATVTIRDGKPSHITCAKRATMQGEILWTTGPWRSSGDWWEQNGWARDEWDIAVQEKSGIALYRLVRDLLSGKWLVEGMYD